MKPCYAQVDMLISVSNSKNFICCFKTQVEETEKCFLELPTDFEYATN